MFDKINIYVVISDHIHTLKNYSTGKYRAYDFVLLFLLPVVAAVILESSHGALGSDATTILAASLSIFAALLFNLLLLIYDATGKGLTGDNLRLLEEVFGNVSFAILLAIVAITLLLVLVLIEGCLARTVLSIAVYYLVSAFLLTLLMVLKRVHILISEEFKVRRQQP